MAAEGHPVRSTAALLHISESGYYSWRRRGPARRSLRQAWLTRLILTIYRSSGGVYGYRRIHYELNHRYGLSVSHGTVEMLMRQAGIQGQHGAPRLMPAHFEDFGSREEAVNTAVAAPEGR
ncbi:IS3 family transposase [Streptomyces sp. NPDC020490]|uniref:IS3 family transposase n=1 Tax=Streptomyces sp. NPDC020490 TaxID=3365078 RepID=UPI003799BA6B